MFTFYLNDNRKIYQCQKERDLCYLCAKTKYAKGLLNKFVRMCGKYKKIFPHIDNLSKASLRFISLSRNAKDETKNESSH
jgi:hypothetical protein